MRLYVDKGGRDVGTGDLQADDIGRENLKNRGAK